MPSLWLWVASVALGSKTLSQEGEFRLIMRFAAATWLSQRSDVGIQAVPQDRETLDQLLDSTVEAPFRLKSGPGDPRIRHNVVALVRVLAAGDRQSGAPLHSGIL